ncbi:hypothetical protein CIPAW_13G125100 [Carya illinoinensis]|uniref:Transposase n=1 Tax=Carya illinoinensis TaxID=32201 RepID=A0A8T1NK10_CARIL|nr:hypothetical protein CIPAW_13G125100 [Carya illinoinensis]
MPPPPPPPPPNVSDKSNIGGSQSGRVRSMGIPLNLGLHVITVVLRMRVIQRSMQCKKGPFKNTDKSQTTLGWKMEGGSGGGGLVPISFSVEACRQALTEMIIVDELPFRFVEGEGFRKFMLVVCPKWVGIPSRWTIAKDCFNLFISEKIKLKSALRGQRISLTTDTWTSVQNLNYMCLTAHFIDDDWKLHKRILSFSLVENHKGDTLGKGIELCLHDWGRPKILAITLDNASSNNGAISYLKKKTKYRRDTVLEHEFLHVRCCAHILNLIVREGLKEYEESIAKVRGVVKYVKSSPQRWDTFKKCVALEEIKCKSHVCLDVPTRWNSTYLMLERAGKFRKAFDRLEEEDMCFLSSIGDDDDDDDEGDVVTRRKSKKLGPPNASDWDKVRLFEKFLALFHDATLRFSGGEYVTCNTFFSELVNIKNAINIECEEGSPMVGLMASNMKRKFEKYWENMDNQNMLLYVGIVLDPRYKMRYLDFGLRKMYAYDQSKIIDMSWKVKNAFIRMYEAYIQNEEGSSPQRTSSPREDASPSTTQSTNRHAALMAQFKQELQSEDSLESRSEVDRYLAEKCEDEGDNFDLLNWWKVNSVRYRILSKVARDVLAIPVSTVASESTFSTAGRVLDPFRSSLNPMMVEALICAQNWLRSSSTPISLRTLMDEVEEFEKQIDMGM